MSDYFYSLESLLAREGYIQFGTLPDEGLFPCLANEENQ